MQNFLTFYLLVVYKMPDTFSSELYTLITAVTFITFEGMFSLKIVRLNITASLSQQFE